MSISRAKGLSQIKKNDCDSSRLGGSGVMNLWQHKSEEMFYG